MEPTENSETEPAPSSYGHRRQPALGKAMPVTSLLLNFPPTQARYTRSGEHELPPLFFTLDDEDVLQTPKKDLTSSEDEAEDVRDEPAYELLVSDCSSDEEDLEKVKINAKRRNNDPDDRRPQNDKLNLLGKRDSYTACLTCTNNAPYELGTRPSAINEMCRRLCTDECRLRLSLAGFVPPTVEEDQIKLNELQEIFETQTPAALAAPPPTNLSIQRKRFLNEVLRKAASDTDSDFTDDAVIAAAPKSQLYAIVNDIVKAKGAGDVDVNVVDDDTMDFLEQYDIAEALAKTSAMTSTSHMKQRLAARKLEIELDNSRKQSQTAVVGTIDNGEVNNDDNSSNNNTALGVTDAEEVDPLPPLSAFWPTSPSHIAYDVPPRDLLLYLVRMGSFNSAPKINNNDTQDDDFELPKNLNTTELLKYLKELRGEQSPALLSRSFYKSTTTTVMDAKIAERRMHCLNLGATEKAVSGNESISDKPPADTLRIFQWNILSQTLGKYNDGFVCCPEEALTWQNRKLLIVEEILQSSPDVICLQEVDHFKFLKIVLGPQNYEGIFFPKPDSPCLYIDQNNGPDGCAIFFRNDKFELKNFSTRILEVWRVQSNQVAIAAILQLKGTDREFCICTTHLKARHGSLLAKLRNEQGRDLLRFVKSFADERLTILCGDFNAEPTEPIYTTILTCDILNLSSAYADINVSDDALDSRQNKENSADSVDAVERSIKLEPPYTTWKIRESGEECHTIDYVFYTQQKLQVKNCLGFPQADEIGKNRTPSRQYPSDHFSLVCDFEFIFNQEKANASHVDAHE